MAVSGLENTKLGSPSGFYPGVEFSKIYCAPNNTLENRLMEEVSRRLNFSHHRGFENESSMLDALHEYFGNCTPSHVPDCPSVIGGVVLNVDFDKKQFAYTIRLPNADRTTSGSEKPQIWDTERFFPKLNPLKYKSVRSSYSTSGFLNLQLAIDDAIKYLLNCTDSSDVDVQAFDIAPDRNVVPGSLNLSLNLALLVILVYLIRNVLREKETGLKEFMRVMGLNSWTQFLVHFLWAFIKLFIVSLVALVPAFVTLNADAEFKESDPSLFFIFMLILSLALICNGFLICALFQKASLAMVAVVIIYNALSFVYAAIDRSSWPVSANIAFLLVFNFAFSDGLYLFNAFENAGVGMQWKYIATPYSANENVTLLLVIAMLFVQMLICIIITWYLENVNPGGGGARRKPWFVFQPSYWFGSNSKEV